MVDEFGGEPAHGRIARSDEAWGPAPRPSVTERAAGALSALTSAALVLGLGYWTYDLAMRDLTAVPVVRALEGPARVAPDEPGGAVARHQGLAVNAIQADDADRPAPERVVLAPRAQPLAEDDRAPAAVKSARAAPPLGIGPPGGAQVMLASADSAARWGGTEVDSQPAEADPLRAALAEALEMPEPEPAAALDAALDGDGLSRSPRPSGRPAIRPTSPEVPASALPSGTQLVQVGDFVSADAARAEWKDLAGRFAPYLQGKAPVVQAAQSNGRAFYRLRAAGFDDGADAKRLCAALSAADVGCVPVTVR